MNIDDITYEYATSDQCNKCRHYLMPDDCGIVEHSSNWSIISKVDQRRFWMDRYRIGVQLLLAQSRGVLSSVLSSFPIEVWRHY